MISAIIYLIDGVILAIFFYRVFTSVSGKITKNPFAAYFSWATFFYSTSFLLAFVSISVAIMISNNNILFWTDYIGRVFFYIGAIFAVQIPLYKYFPKNNRRFILSYLYGLIGVALIIYQFTIRNIPTVDSAGLVNWHAGPILSGGIALLMLVPWAATSVIFISEFVKSKFKLPKPFFLGFGFFLVCVGAIFQDLSNNALYFIIFSVILTIGFLLVLVGMFYKEE